ncbi:MAG: type III-B CRISPR module-associated protein Cmr3 [Anaerolineae bacterium]|nr:type III-B CRISPR module-associated protein Cmr3 [Anaerolineae bacterium]
MIRLFIEPIDVWMFRDGRPFDAGSQHRAVSLFPPPPMVMQGALRSKHLSVMGADLSRHARRQGASIIEIGYSDESYGAFRMLGPFIACQDDTGHVWRYYPRPADAVNVRGMCVPATPRQVAGVESNLPDLEPDLQLLWPPPPVLQPDEHEESEWWREDALKDYLEHGEVMAGHEGIIPEKELVERESRVGIVYQEDTGTVEEGMLYEAEFVRPRDGVGLDVEMAQLPTPWPENGALTLGGELRGARYRILDQPAEEIPRQPDGECFKLYFATPAYFDGGWRPQNGWAELVGPGVKLIGAALNRPLVVGGYDLAKGAHKPSRRFVPAGSVYYFKGRATLKGAVTQWGAEIGLGHYFVGGWKC